MNTLEVKGVHSRFSINSNNTWKTATAMCLELPSVLSNRKNEIEEPFDSRLSKGYPSPEIHSGLSGRLDTMDFKNILCDLHSMELA